MKQALCDVGTVFHPLGQPPEDVLSLARSLRLTFGPGVKLLRVVGDGVELGRPIWDDPQAEWDSQRGKP